MNPINTKDPIIFRPRIPGASADPVVQHIYPKNQPSDGYARAESRIPTPNPAPPQQSENDVDQDKDASSIAGGSQAQLSRYSEFERAKDHRLEPTS